MKHTKVWSPPGEKLTDSRQNGHLAGRRRLPYVRYILTHWHRFYGRSDAANAASELLRDAKLHQPPEGEAVDVAGSGVGADLPEDRRVCVEDVVDVECQLQVL